VFDKFEILLVCSSKASILGKTLQLSSLDLNPRLASKIYFGFVRLLLKGFWRWMPAVRLEFEKLKHC
jgi:hypothetical protein